MRFYSLPLMTALLAGAALPSVAATLSVPSKAYPTIQSAVSAAKPGDTVLVSAKPKGGVYNEAVTITTPNIVLQGQGNPVIDGTGLGTLVPQPPFQPYYVYPNDIEIQASHVAVRGLTVQNAGGSSFGGASGINAGYVTPDGQTDVGFSDIEISGVTVRNNYDGITIMGYAGTSPFYGGTPVSLKGYRLLNCVVTGNTSIAAQVLGGSNIQVTGCRFTNNSGAGLTVGSNVYGTPMTENALVVGNMFTGNTGDGLDAFGDGLLITANEAASNIVGGIYTEAPTYNPALSSRSNPAPPASAVTFNFLHDNFGTGLTVTGTQTVSGNLLTHNTGYGLYLYVADYSTVSFNAVTKTALLGGLNQDGAGIYADSGYFFTGNGGFLTISANTVTGNVGDGIYLASVVGSTVSSNDASGNMGVGIHLSDFPSHGDPANTVTLNRALHNTLFDARDDATAPDNLTYNGGTSYGDNGQYGPTVNIWTKNLFGTTDPAGLSK